MFLLIQVARSLVLYDWKQLARYIAKMAAKERLYFIQIDLCKQLLLQVCVHAGSMLSMWSGEKPEYNGFIKCVKNQIITVRRKICYACSFPYVWNPIKLLLLGMIPVESMKE